MRVENMSESSHYASMENIQTRIPKTYSPAVPIFGALPQLQKSPLKVMFRAASEFGDLVRVPLPTIQMFVAGHPDLAEHILVTNSKNYTKDTRGYNMLRRVLGNGLVTSEGAFWKRQRRIAQPAFHREKIARFADSMVRAASECAEAWPTDAAFDLNQEMMKVTLRIVGETLLSTDVTSSTGEIGAAVTHSLELMIWKITHPFSLPGWIPTKRNREFVSSKKTLDDVVNGIIAKRRAGETHPDLLQMFLDTTDSETNESMNDAQLRDEVMTMFLAGHETTANALSWTFWLLSAAPDVENELIAEIKEVLGDRAATMADVPKLKVANNILKESMRLYPPIWTLGRRVEETEIVKGYTIPKGALVFVCPYWLHRHPQFWESPNEFKPSRWNDPNVLKHRSAYIPFSAGQRKCIGDSFATMEAILLLCTFLQKRKISIVPGQQVEPEPVVTLRPSTRIQAIATRR
jgi:cytochrome P450